MALEEYIKQVKETWTSYTLDLVNYQNKCRLIRYVTRHYDLVNWAKHLATEVGMISLTSVASISTL